MKDVLCPVCTGFMRYSFSAQVLRKYNADYYYCEACGYLKVDEPYWLDEAYSSAIADADTGLVSRNIAIAKKISSLLYWGMGGRGEMSCLDSAGGYGMLTRLMRDYGFNFYWSDKYCQNLLARGFESNVDGNEFAIVTAVEVMEHVLDPVGYVQETMHASGAGTFIFTTELYEGVPPLPDDWWYYSLETGQHIGFFQNRTLRALGDKLNLNFYSANGVHVLTEKKLSARRVQFVTGGYFIGATGFLLRRLLRSRTMDDHRKLLGRASNR